MAGITNIAACQRNGSGIGSGRIVGWLPIVRKLSGSLLSYHMKYFTEYLPRSATMPIRKERQHLPISSGLSGMIRFGESSKTSSYCHTLAIFASAPMEFSVFFIPLFISCQPTMKSSELYASVDQ